MSAAARTPIPAVLTTGFSDLAVFQAVFTVCHLFFTVFGVKITNLLQFFAVLDCGVTFASITNSPTSAILSVEDRKHPATRHLPKNFKSSPNEWYRWENDLRTNPDIKILLSIDSTSFPLGTGPKQDEIWHSGYYPVVWTNKKYRMIYFNMGHNDIDYEGATNKELSHTFGNKTEDKLILDALLWLGRSK